MVFSFFSKKPPAKMVAKPAVIPRPLASGGDLSARDSAAAKSSEEAGKGGAFSAPAGPDAVEDSSIIEFSEFVFSESSPDFQLEEEMDPVDAKAEEAAVLFANAQDDAVQAVLDEAVRIYDSGRGERLWLMLFDLYRVRGKRTAFEALGIDFAKCFEKSPPVWRDRSAIQPVPKVAAAGALLFGGELVADNSIAFEGIRQALAKNKRLRLDMSKVGTLDVGGCALLLSVLQQARKDKCQLELLGREALGSLVESKVESGRAEAEPCWLLLLELCQLQGRLEAFEDVAINYAITFEVSPPSWEASRVAAPEPVVSAVTVGPGDELLDAYTLRDEIKSSRFGDLAAYADTHEPVLIDCAALNRIDFISAGALLNVLTAVRRKGKQIIFRHPNHLVAELFGVVGLNAVATIVFARN